MNSHFPQKTAYNRPSRFHALRKHLLTSVVPALLLAGLSSGTALAQVVNPYDSANILSLLRQAIPADLPEGVYTFLDEAAADAIAKIMAESNDLRFDRRWPLESILLKAFVFTDDGIKRYPGQGVTPEAAKAVATIASRLQDLLPVLPPYKDPGRLGDPASWITPEFEANWGLAATNTQYAYAYNKNGFSGITGKGVKVGVLDSGIFSGHVEFQEHLHLVDVKGVYGTTHPKYKPRADDTMDGTIQAGTPFNISGEFDPEINAPHGSEMTGTIMATRDGAGMHGVAYEADAYFANTGGTDDNRHFGSNDLDYNYFKAAYEALGDAGVRVVNNSWGQDSLIPLEAEILPTPTGALPRGALFPISMARREAKTGSMRRSNRHKSIATSKSSPRIITTMRPTLIWERAHPSFIRNLKGFGQHPPAMMRPMPRSIINAALPNGGASWVSPA
jgi:subtilisin family serine protease